MTYTVKFRDDALKEWLKLDKSIQQQFAKKLKKCSENPHIPSAKLRGLKRLLQKSNFAHRGFVWSIRLLMTC